MPTLPSTDGYSPISGPLPPGCPPVGAVIATPSLPSPAEGADRVSAATATWRAYCARRGEQGDRTPAKESARNSRVRALVYSSVCQREDAGPDGATIRPYEGRTVKAPDGTTSRSLPAGAIRTYAPIVPRTTQDDNGEVSPVIDDRGRHVYDVRTDRAMVGVPLGAVKRIASRYRIGASVKWPKLAGYGAYCAVTGAGPTAGTVTVGTVIPCASVGRLLADVGVRMSPDRDGALLVPCSSEHVVEWASHVHGDRDPDVGDEATYEDALVTVAVGAAVLPADREARASARATDRLTAGAGTDVAPVLRRILAIRADAGAAKAAK